MNQLTTIDYLTVLTLINTGLTLGNIFLTKRLMRKMGI